MLHALRTASSTHRRAAGVLVAASSAGAAACGLAGYGTAVASSSSGPPRVRIASYNLLSDSLCRASHFDRCDPADLDNEVRFTRVQRKLKSEMDQGAVLCLQEVSRRWGAKLVPFFERHGYNYAAGLSGGPFNGYMGQVVAWPTGTYAVDAVDVTRVSDTVAWPETKRRDGRKKQEQGSGWMRSLRDWSASILGGGPQAEMAPFDAWKVAKKRHNCVVLVRLRRKEEEDTDTDTDTAAFVVGNYHMPCLFGSDEKCQVMVAHAAMLMQHAQAWAGNDPLVVAGDFNLAPDVPAYRVITEGSISTDHPHHPTPAPWDAAWTPTVAPMRSAYAACNGTEPEATNYALTAWSKDDAAFCETLDYIFLSSGWEVASVLPVPSAADREGVLSYPSAEEPSDHVMIAAELLLGRADA